MVRLEDTLLLGVMLQSGNVSNHLALVKSIKNKSNKGATIPYFLGIHPKGRPVGPNMQAGIGIFCSLCFKLSGRMECQFCKGECQKAGRQKNGTQKHYCKRDKKYQQVMVGLNGL